MEDVRFALRTLRRRPAWTAAAVLTLGLGIGAAVSMFSVVDGVLLRPLPYEEPGRLVTIWYTFPHWREDPQLGDQWDRLGLPYPEYRRLRERSRTLAGVGAYRVQRMVVSGPGAAEEAAVAEGSVDLMPLLGVQPALGRWFLPGEGGEGSPRLVVLSDAYWRESLAADRGVLGRTLRIDGAVFEVIGVLPAGVRLRSLGAFADASGPARLWIPIGATGDRIEPLSFDYEAIGRLAPGATLEAARTEVEAVLRGDADPGRRGARLLPRHAAETGEVRSPLLLLLGAVGLLLLVSCANVAALLLGEAPGREAELATRAALGAGRGRIVRQLLTESMVLAVLGGALGLLLGHAGIRALVALAPAGMPRIDEVAMNGRVLAFALVSASATGLLFGLAPALSLGRSATVARGRDGGRVTARRGSLEQALVAGQMAVCALLLIGASLLVRSLATESAVDPGFRSDGLLVLRTEAPRGAFADPADAYATMERVRERLAGLPGVVSVTVTKNLPFSSERQSWTVSRADIGEGAPRVHARRHSVDPGFFATMEIPVRSGRPLDARDRGGAPAVAVVNETMARTLWQDRSPLGLALRTPNGPLTIVGIVADTRDEALDLPPQPTFYMSYPQRPDAAVWLVVRVTGDRTARLGPLIQREVRAAAPALAVEGLTTMDALIAGTLGEDRYRSALLSLFAGAAALLALVGIAGVTARAVGRRTREIAIRVALGAIPLAVAGRFAAWTLPAALLGIAVGIAAALGAARLLEAYLFGVGSADPVTFATVGGGLLLCVLCSGAVAARRAASIRPAAVLRA